MAEFQELTGVCKNKGQNYEIGMILFEIFFIEHKIILMP
jgi:hypothetical protein